jgi:hypothetical protein
MKVAVKYLILIFGFIAGVYSLKENIVGAGIASAGAFISFALLEIEDLKIINDKEED